MDKLQEHVYLTETILRILKQNRITTILDFLQEDAEKLSTLTKLNLPQILEIRQDIFNKHSANLISGSTLFVNNITCKKFIPTGINSLDTILEGGLPVGLITEICGLAGSGKSQLCMQLAINSVMGSNYTILYIDTKGDFSAVRIQKILEAHGLSHKDMAVIMLNIRVVYIWNIEELIKLLENIKNDVLKIENVSMIIVDSLPCLTFQHFGDNNTIGLTYLNRVINYSRYLSKVFQMGFIFVNIQTRWIDQDISDPEDTECAYSIKDLTYTEKRTRCLGKYWKTIPALVLVLEKNKLENNICDTVKVLVTKHINPTEVKSCFIKVNAQGVS
ncbi:DNA repair protein RAD51 homolog 4 isoform X1 [Nymphalis io]|uniref:DNA repair protein RAD51 homolog 4 isoform X1 n=1 Tax=Inachis io TaxID=171585 RepID=UPI00216AB19F|nr:DNA repair protein RAD51 homolog 4 isoform X1 [Nymphalis io]